MTRTISVVKTTWYATPSIILSQSNGDESIVLSLPDARKLAEKILETCNNDETQVIKNLNVTELQN